MEKMLGKTDVSSFVSGKTLAGRALGRCNVADLCQQARSSGCHVLPLTSINSLIGVDW